MTNRLHYGDNLDVLRDRSRFPDECVDLIYLDPPFNSSADYNQLFKTPDGKFADAQVEAFVDTWHWNEHAATAYDEVIRSGSTDVSDLLRAMKVFLGENDMMAYLSMMAIRLIELKRVLKPTGSLFLHCDPTAGHYLKILLDGVFGKLNFRNEIVWCYRKWSITQGQFVRNHDTIFFYSRKNGSQIFNPLYQEPSAGTMKRWGGKKQQAVFEDGVRKASSTEEKAQSAMPDWWDISILNPNSKERLGYPTQKPLALLERIIEAASPAGGVVLDPFCGCGTAVHAAEKLGRKWIGIDVTHLAVGLIERRLKHAFPGVAFDVIGKPADLASAERLAREEPYQFQYWITNAVDGVPYQGGKKGADRGIDGYLYFRPDGKELVPAIISVKAGRNIGVAMVRDLRGVIEREGAAAGIFICLANPTRQMEQEAAAAGVFMAVDGRTYPKVQIFTAAELFQGRLPRLPFVDATAMLKRSPREDRDQQISLKV